jgi:hypothetical protein
VAVAVGVKMGEGVFEEVVDSHRICVRVDVPRLRIVAGRLEGPGVAFGQGRRTLLIDSLGRIVLKAGG